MSQPDGRGTVDVHAATLLLAETPTVIVNDHVAVVGEWARPATVASAEQAATLIFDRAPAIRPIDNATPTSAASTSSAVRYVVVGVAGRGGMGTVHVAQDVELLRRVALKELSNDAARDRLARSRFVREVQVTAQLDHPYIVPVYGLEVADGGRPAYAMKLVEGRTFAQLIAETKTASEHDGVDEAHSLPARLEHFLKVCDATNLVRDGQIPGVRATLLLDRDGTMLAMHDASPVDGRSVGAGPSPALVDEVRRAVRMHDGGFVQTSFLGAPAIAAFDRIHPLDWLLVSIVPERTLLDLAPPTPSQPRTATTRPPS